MQVNYGGERFFLSLLVCGLCIPASAVVAEVAIQNVVVDGQVQSLPAADGGRGLLCIPSTARSVRFLFADDVPAGGSAVRLRYKLEGHDDNWHDLRVRMRMLVLFYDRNGQIVGSHEFYLEGETPGWRSKVEEASFVSRRTQVPVPDRAATAGIAFLSHGGEAALGVMGVDAVRVLVERPGAEPGAVFDLGVTRGNDLGRPIGTPANWTRAGSRLELAELRTRATPDPHPILVIRDDDPQNYGNWSTAANHAIPVRPGDRLTVTWKIAHSIGGSGAGQADYEALKPGSYWFRVAAVKADGEPAGDEVSLPVEVRVPVYLRVEFWLVASAFVLGAAAWIGRLAGQRRMQRRIAEIEHEQALDRERARIARDLHDEVGAGLTEIAMQSDLVRRDIAGANLPDTQRRLERVCESAVSLVRSVDEIVWAVNPANDTIERFVSYLSQSTEQFLEAAGLRVRFDIPEPLPARSLSGVQRHFLFVAVREALNNSVRHAKADLVRMEIRCEAGALRVVIEDNGCGFRPEGADGTGTGDGLENMRRRMEEIGGEFSLTSRHGHGTRVEFSVKVTNA
jgi:signal transduction histidine kinase